MNENKELTIQYPLHKEDFLQYQLFYIDQSGMAKRSANIGRFLLLAIFTILGLIFYKFEKLIAIYFVISAIICFLLYPLFQKWYYKRFFSKFVEKQMSKRFGQPITLTFTATDFHLQDITGEARILFTNIEEITETTSYIFPKLKTGGHIIISKSKLPQEEEVRTWLAKCCENLGIAYHRLDWKG